MVTNVATLAFIEELLGFKMETEISYVNYSEVKIGDIVTDGNDVFVIVNASDVMYPNEYSIDCLVMYRLSSFEIGSIKSLGACTKR